MAIVATLLMKLRYLAKQDIYRFGHKDVMHLYSHCTGLAA